MHPSMSLDNDFVCRKLKFGNEVHHFKAKIKLTFLTNFDKFSLILFKQIDLKFKLQLSPPLKKKEFKFPR